MDKQHDSTYMRVHGAVKFTKTESRVVVARNGNGGKCGVSVQWYRVPVWEDEQSSRNGW